MMDFFSWIVDELYALLWRFGFLIVDQEPSIGMSSPNESLGVLDVDDEDV